MTNFISVSRPATRMLWYIGFQSPRFEHHQQATSSTTSLFIYPLPRRGLADVLYKKHCRHSSSNEKLLALSLKKNMAACPPMKNEETIYSFCIERNIFFWHTSKCIALMANDVVN